MLGVDCFTENDAQLKGRPFGLLTNHATFSGSGYPVAHELLRQGFSIKKLFSPEHGIQSQGEDGVAQKNAYDPYTKLPIVSLYGESMKPHSSDLEDIDIILIDLPNIGCRFYTYWWTITYMLEACAASGKKIILLDRPNISQRSLDSIEGPMLEKGCQSFLGRWPMPLTFSQSFGELT
ncbi:MAG: exo-beta-N-acetylmuramidase NamZ domain-containing protein, partial [Cyclobacteriaceae bacterium]